MKIEEYINNRHGEIIEEYINNTSNETNQNSRGNQSLIDVIMSVDFGSKNTQATIAARNHQDYYKVKLYEGHDGNKTPSNLLVQVFD